MAKTQETNKGASMKSQMSKKHKCMLGEYAHSCSEYFSFRYPKDIDGLGHLFPLIFYKYCSYCGKDLKDDIKKIWGDYKYKAPKLPKL